MTYKQELNMVHFFYHHNLKSSYVFYPICGQLCLISDPGYYKNMACSKYYLLLLINRLCVIGDDARCGTDPRNICYIVF